MSWVSQMIGYSRTRDLELRRSRVSSLLGSKRSPKKSQAQPQKEWGNALRSKGPSYPRIGFLGKMETYAEEALQERPMPLPVKISARLVDKLMQQKEVSEGEKKADGQATPQAEAPSLEKAFGKPKDLWVVTKGRGWKSRPRHVVTKAAKATWQLPIEEWSTGCGWVFATHCAEFYFLTGAQVDKLKCQKCEAYVKGATTVREEVKAPQLADR